MDKRARIVGQRIRQMMGGRKLEDVARDVEAKTGKRFDRSSFQKWATGERLPRLQNIFTLAEYSGKPAGWFLMSDEEIAGLCAQQSLGLNAALDVEVERILSEYPVLTFSPRRRPMSDRDKLLLLALIRYFESFEKA